MKWEKLLFHKVKIYIAIVPIQICQVNFYQRSKNNLIKKKSSFPKLVLKQMDNYRQKKLKQYKKNPYQNPKWLIPIDLTIKPKKYNASRMKVKGREFSVFNTRPIFLDTKIIAHKKKN